MTSKRDLISAVHALKCEVANEKRAKSRALDEARELRDFLATILELDPTLDHFRRDEPSGQYVGASHRVWDIEGVKAAKEFQRNQSIAAKYTEQQIAGRRLYESEKKSAGSANVELKHSNFDGLGRVL